MEITFDATKIRLAAFQLEGESQVWWDWVNVRPEKFQFLEKGQNHNFSYKIVISVKNLEFIL